MDLAQSRLEGKRSSPSPLLRAALPALLLHSLMLVWAWRLLPDSGARSVKLPPRWVELELGASDEAMQNLVRSGTVLGPRIRKAQHGRPSLARLGISLQELIGDRSSQKSSGPPQTEADARAGRGHPGVDLRRESREYSVVQAIHRRIEAHLAYPDELKQHGVQGEVEARLQFDEKGRFLEGPSLQSLAGPPYLRVLVARTLREALRERPAPLAHAMQLDCYFRFLIAEGDDELIRQAGNFAFDRDLAFLRVFHHSKMEWDLGPFHGLGVFAVGADLLWVPRKIIEAANEKAVIDPLESYRQDPAW